MDKAIKLVNEMIEELHEICPKSDIDMDYYGKIQDEIEVLEEVTSRLKHIELRNVIKDKLYADSKEKDIDEVIKLYREEQLKEFIDSDLEIEDLDLWFAVETLVKIKLKWEDVKRIDNALYKSGVDINDLV